MKKTIVTCTAALAVAVAAGLGWAAVPSSSGVIDACRSANGSLRVIDAEAGQSCGGNQTALQWNAAGPQGPTGPQGPAGASAEIGWVGIQADGTGYAGASVYPVTAMSKIGTGHYEIDFAASMLACARWVSTATGPRVFSIGHVSGDPSKLRMHAYDLTGASVDTPLTVFVSC